MPISQYATPTSLPASPPGPVTGTPMVGAPEPSGYLAETGADVVNLAGLGVLVLLVGLGLAQLAERRRWAR